MEKYIDGILCYQTTPDNKWKPVGINRLNEKLLETEKELDRISGILRKVDFGLKDMTEKTEGELCMKQLWIKEDEPLTITRRVWDGQSYQRDKDGNIVLPRGFLVLSVDINGVTFIPETNATRQADRFAHIFKEFLKEE